MLLMFNSEVEKKKKKKKERKKEKTGINIKYLISRDLLKQRHIKNQERFIASRRFAGHRDSIIKRLVK